MKKIIENRVYDTDTARQLATWRTPNSSPRDFHYVEESLYRKRTGEFFLHGAGGPSTRYARSTGQNSWSGGEKIIPLTVEAAMKWAEEHLDADDYAAIFGLPDESAEDVTLLVKVPAALAAKARTLAAERTVSVKEIVVAALTAYLS